MDIEPIIIVGPPRSGSSSVAEIVQNLGVFIGDEFVELTYNPKGTFEDKEFFNITLRYTSGWINLDKFKKNINAVIQKRKDLGKMWGWKDPRTYKLLDIYFEYFENPRFIRCIRPAHKCMDSMTRCFGWERERAYETFNAINYILDEKLEGYLVLKVFMEDLIDGTAKDKIEEFIKKSYV